MIVVDTSVWSHALRRASEPDPPHPAVALLRRLIEQDADLCIPGVVLQELLSGVRHEAQFRRLRRVLHTFPVVLATEEAHVAAAQLFNACRSGGVAATAIDCLIAATATQAEAKLLAIDGDYEHMARVVPLELVDWRHSRP